MSRKKIKPANPDHLSKVCSLKDLLKGTLKKPDVAMLSVEYFMREFSFLDFNPRYQRGFVWSKTYQRELIMSILRGIPIGVIHLVNKQNYIENEEIAESLYRDVLDGRQRLQTIMNYIKDEFFIEVIDTNSNLRQLYWKDIKDGQGEAALLRKRFTEYQIQTVTWKSLTFEEQKELFNTINNSEALRPLEKRFANHVLSKMFLKSIFNNEFKPVLKWLEKSLLEDNRYTGTNLLFSILIWSYGWHFNEMFQYRRTDGKKQLQDSIDYLEKLLANNGITINTPLTTLEDEQFIRNIKFDVILDELGHACKWFNICMTQIHKEWHKLPTKNIILDIISFFIGKQQLKILTNSYFEANIPKMTEFIKKYLIFKIEKHLNEHSTSNVKARIDAMEQLFIESGLDNSVKNQKIKEEQKEIALFNAHEKCPVTGVYLTKDNIQLDHVNPKGIASKTEVRAISDIGNRIKSDLTTEVIDKIKNYIEENERKDSGLDIFAKKDE